MEVEKKKKNAPNNLVERKGQKHCLCCKNPTQKIMCLKNGC